MEDGLPGRTVIGRLLALMALAGTISAQEQPSSTREFWPEIDIFLKFNDHTRLLLLAAWVKDRDTESREIELGVLVDVFVPRFRPVLFRRLSKQDDARARRIVLRPGYRYLRNSSGTSIEHRFQTEATLRWAFPADILMSDRNRGEYRYINGDFSWRYRNELRFERDFKIRKSAVTPYASGEIFYDSRFNTVSRWRVSAGIVFSIRRRWGIEPYYTYQIAREPEFIRTNAAGLTVSFYGP